MSVNHLVDRTELELKALRGKQYTAHYNGGQPFPHNAEKEVTEVPDSLDWRLYGAVTPVKGVYLSFLIIKNISIKIFQYSKLTKNFLN